MKKYSIYFVTFIIFLSCSNNKTAEQLWKDGNDYRVNGELKESITALKSIIDKYPNNELSAKAQFQIADIYLNDTKNYEFSIKEFKKVVNNYPESDMSKKSLFMIGYIFNNYMSAYSDAIIYYNLFKEKYPNDELIPSVEYELEGLKKIQSEIDTLNSKVIEDSNI